MKKTVSILLFFQVLFVSLGFATNVHYCKGKLVETSLSLGFDDIGCGMGLEQKACSSNAHTQNETLSKKCCDNEHQMLKVDEQIRFQLEDFQFNNFFVVLVYTFAGFAITETYPNPYVSNNSSPPLIKSAFQILYQVFLI